MLETQNHDSKAFTQGFSFFDGHIYEGTGLNGESSLRKLDRKNPETYLQSFDIPDEYFGEGITHYKDGRGNDRIVQITWRERTAFVYDARKLEVIFTFKYHIDTSNGEGWGITFDEGRNEFIVSDGTEQLFFWDVSILDSCESLMSTQDDYSVDDFVVCNIIVEASRQVKVHAFTSETSTPHYVGYLNELELISRTNLEGTTSNSILANVWFQNYLIEICPISGVVLRLYDLSDLCPPKLRTGENVLNGISMSDEGDDIIYVTGKQWHQMYKIKLI